ncbi:ABC transporter permease [Erysipelothrix inopinata]|uniref:ABC transporter permease n=1 Tax=Erysipelothrix inopinata TaxID=225084 RepID=A0A7G9S028_9FIRM|nr:ABC transporter permease [Erysipelothrix inopinata]QNN61203.1 ABC transporter permease [Erysipelothrix inopinata]
MNITKRISLQNVKKNWKASLLTIISISLSVAMTTMVVASLFGVYKTYEEDKLYKSSKWNVEVGIQDDADEIISALGEIVDSYAVISRGKYVDVGTELDRRSMSIDTIDFKSNFSMFSDEVKVGKDSFDDLIIEGRLPQSKDELIITSRSKTEFSLNLDDIVTIKQSVDNYENPSNDEIFSEARIVGIMAGSSNGIDFTGALRQYYPSDSNDNWKTLYIKFKPGTKNIEKIMEPIGKEFDPSLPNHDGIRILRYNETYNTILGMQFKLDTTKVILGVASAVFIVLLSLATFSLITNAFYNNIQTQVHDYGLLRSIGATKKQLKSMIRFEGYILLSIGLAFGIGVGFGIGKLLLNYINSIFSFSNQAFGTTINWVFSPVLPWQGILIITVFSFILVSFPLNHSIKKLFKMTSIDAIRENNRYVRNKLKIYSRNLSKSLAKQYSISEKSKFRGIKISLTITIVIFITTMSFIKIGFSNMGEYNTSKYNVEVAPQHFYAASLDSFNKKNEEMRHILEKDSNTKIYLIFSQYNISIRDKNFDPLKIYKEVPQNNSANSDIIKLLIMDDHSFDIVRNSLDIQEKNIDSILVNYGTIYDFDRVSSDHTYEGIYFDFDSTESLYIGESVYNDKNPDSYIFNPIFEIPVDAVIARELPDFDSLSYPYIIVNSDSVRFNAIQESLLKSEAAHLNRFAAIVQTHDSFETVKLFDSEDYYISNQDVDKAIPKLIEKTITNILVSIMTFITLVCLLNVVNISLTNLNTRKRELAALRSVGMSQKQVQKMLFYESVRLAWNPLIMGTLIGIFASYSIIAIVNLFIINGQPIAFSIDIRAILISWCILLLLIVSNTIITIVKSRNHSIIESLRNL